MSLNLLGIAILGLASLWLLGSFLLRAGGLLVMFAGALGLVIGGDGGGIAMICLGLLAWLAGHWHFALRHHEYKSPLARYVFCRWAPSWADPTRNWAVAVVPEQTGQPDRARGGRR